MDPINLRKNGRGCYDCGGQHPKSVGSLPNGQLFVLYVHELILNDPRSIGKSLTLNPLRDFDLVNDPKCSYSFQAGLEI